MAKKRIEIKKPEDDEQIDEIENAEKEDKTLESIFAGIQAIAPYITEWQKASAPAVKRWQIIHFTVMMTVLIIIGILAYYKIIDGSAATGLIGAVIGYVFGGLYQQRTK